MEHDTLTTLMYNLDYEDEATRSNRIYLRNLQEEEEAIMAAELAAEMRYDLIIADDDPEELADAAKKFLATYGNDSIPF